jgi:hypothetical protein
LRVTEDRFTDEFRLADAGEEAAGALDEGDEEQPAAAASPATAARAAARNLALWITATSFYIG